MNTLRQMDLAGLSTEFAQATTMTYAEAAEIRRRVSTVSAGAGSNVSVSEIARSMNVSEDLVQRLLEELRDRSPTLTKQEGLQRERNLLAFGAILAMLVILFLALFVRAAGRSRHGLGVVIREARRL